MSSKLQLLLACVYTIKLIKNKVWNLVYLILIGLKWIHIGEIPHHYYSSFILLARIIYLVNSFNFYKQWINIKIVNVQDLSFRSSDIFRKCSPLRPVNLVMIVYLVNVFVMPPTKYEIFWSFSLFPNRIYSQGKQQ